MPVNPFVISATDAKVFLYISMLKADGITQKEMADRLGKSAGTVSKSLKNLAKYGFVKAAGGGKRLEHVVPGDNGKYLKAFIGARIFPRKNGGAADAGALAPALVPNSFSAHVCDIIPIPLRDHRLQCRRIRISEVGDCYAPHGPLLPCEGDGDPKAGYRGAVRHAHGEVRFGGAPYGLQYVEQTDGKRWLYAWAPARVIALFDLPERHVKDNEFWDLAGYLRRAFGWSFGAMWEVVGDDSEEFAFIESARYFEDLEGYAVLERDGEGRPLTWVDRSIDKDFNPEGEPEAEVARMKAEELVTLPPRVGKVEGRVEELKGEFERLGEIKAKQKEIIEILENDERIHELLAAKAGKDIVDEVMGVLGKRQGAQAGYGMDEHDQIVTFGGVVKNGK